MVPPKAEHQGEGHEPPADVRIHRYCVIAGTVPSSANHRSMSRRRDYCGSSVEREFERTRHRPRLQIARSIDKSGVGPSNRLRPQSRAGVATEEMLRRASRRSGWYALPAWRFGQRPYFSTPSCVSTNANSSASSRSAPQRPDLPAWPAPMLVRSSRAASFVRVARSLATHLAGSQ